MNRTRRRKHFWVLMLALPMAGCALLSQEEGARELVLVNQREDAGYIVEEARYQDVVRSVTLYASYSQKDSTPYMFSQDGVLEEVYVQEGDQVYAGDLLAILSGYEEARDAVKRYESEQEELKQEQEQQEEQLALEQKRVELLYQYGQLTDQERAQAYGKLELEYGHTIQTLLDQQQVNACRIQEAKEQMEKLAIFSDRDGIVTQALSHVSSSKNQWNGFSMDALNGGSSAEERMNYVTTDKTIVMVADMEDCAFICDTEYADRFQVGDFVTLSGGGDLTYDTVVTEVLDGQVYFMPEVPDLSMAVGTSARYTLILEEQKQVLAVSKGAVHETEDGFYVYYMDEQGLQQITTVSVGITGNTLVEITEGLEPGTMVIK